MSRSSSRSGASSRALRITCFLALRAATNRSFCCFLLLSSSKLCRRFRLRASAWRAFQDTNSAVRGSRMLTEDALSTIGSGVTSARYSADALWVSPGLGFRGKMGRGMGRTPLIITGKGCCGCLGRGMSINLGDVGGI